MSSNISPVERMNVENGKGLFTHDSPSKGEKFRAKFHSVAPVSTQAKKNTLVFKGVTRAQAKRLQSPVFSPVTPLVIFYSGYYIGPIFCLTKIKYNTF